MRFQRNMVRYKYFVLLLHLVASQDLSSTECGEAWTGIKGACYKILPGLTGWNDAKSSCRKEGGELIGFRALERDYDLIRRSFSRGLTNNTFHINVRYSNSTKVFRDLDGSIIGKNQWKNGFPKNLQGWSWCTRIKGGVAVENIDCYNVLSHGVCTKKIPVTIPNQKPRTVECRDGWLLLESQCLLFSEIRQNYTDARKACEEAGSTLGIIKSENLNDIIRLRLDMDSFIGLNEIEFGKKYVWEDGSVLRATDFTDWADGEPNGLDEQCVEILNYSDSYGSWNDAACHEKRGSVCSYQLPLCPIKFEMIDDECYFYSEKPMTYHEMIEHCSNVAPEGSTPIVIRNREENAFAIDQIQNGSLYIGLHYDHGSQEYAWADGGILGPEDFTWWLPGEPALSAGYDCVEITPTGWNTVTCADSLNFICQMKTHTYPSHNCNFNDGLIWKEDPDSKMCYTVFNQPLNWFEAEDLCRSYGGSEHNLMSIKNPSQQKFIHRYLKSVERNGAYWIGLRVELNNFKWSDKTAYGYSNWSPTSPSPVFEDGCASIAVRDLDGKWKKNRCEHTRLPSICQRYGLAYVPPPSPPPMNNCPNGWNRIGSICFFISDIRKPFHEAESFCKSLHEGSTLGLIKTSEIEATIIKYLDDKESYFFGLNDRETENKFIWSDGTSLDESSYSNWNFQEPNDHEHKENCVELSAVPFYGWNDASCENENRFICSMEYSVCPHDWRVFNNRCFYSSDAESSCYKSNKKCGEAVAKGFLASIHNMEENDFLAENLISDYTKSWIGLKRKKGTYYDAWLDGSKLTFENFVYGFKKKDSYECAAINSRGKWESFYSKATLPYTCSLNADRFLKCHSGWIKSERSCFYLSETLKSWDDASRDCHARGGNLARVKQPSDQGFIYSEFPYENEDSKYFWIDLRAKDKDLYFTWSDGFELSYENWNAKFPMSDSKEKRNCVVINREKEGKWENEMCQEFFPYLCERPMEISSHPPESEKGCEGHQMAHDEFCYEIFSTKSTYFKSVELCEFKRGEIVQIKDLLIQSRISSFISQSKSKFFLGLNRVTDSETWVWEDTSELNFANWKSNEPNFNIPNKNGLCVEFLGDVDCLGKWKTVDCDERKDVICQFPRRGWTPPTTPPPTTSTIDPSYKCPDGYSLVGGDCNLYHNYERNFDDARDVCKSVGGDLVSFKSILHQQEVLGVLDLEYASETFIGLRLYPESGGYHWMDLDIIYGTFTNWGVFEPDSDHGRRACVVIRDGKWQSENCIIERPFVCSVKASNKPFTTQPISTPKPDHPCHEGKDDGWFVIPQKENGFCYKFSGEEEILTWHGARLKCNGEDGELASIHDRKENDYLWYKFLKMLPSYESVWIGLSNLNDAGVYKWSDTTAFNFENWRTGEPNDSDGMESCTEIHLKGEGLWNDNHCSVKQGFVCKKPKHGKFTTPKPPPIPPGHCKKGQAEYEGYCYTLDPNIKKSWDQAHLSCQTTNSNLVSIHSERELAFITSRLLSEKMDAKNVWIGGKGMKETGVFYWSDESPFDYTNWDKNEPYFYNFEVNNILMYSLDNFKMGRWFSKRLSSYDYPYICKKRADPSISEMTYALPKCKDDEDFYDYLGTCIKYFNIKKSWTDAKEHCGEMDAKLTSIHSLRENYFYTSFSTSDVWIGLTNIDAPDKTKLLWADQSHYDYDNFREGEEIDSGSSVCTSLSYTSSKWKLDKCTEKRSYFCKLKGSVEPPPQYHGNCPLALGWEKGPLDHCFMIPEPRLMSFEDANLKCLEVGGILAGIHTNADNEWLKNRIEDKKEGHWIGVYRVIQEGDAVNKESYFWLDKVPYVGGYTHWNQGQHHTDGIFGEFHPIAGRWSLVEDTGHRYNYICSARKIIPEPPSVQNTTRSHESTTTTSQENKSSMSPGQIVGAVFGAIIGIALVSGIIFIALTRDVSKMIPKRTSKTQNEGPISFSNLHHQKNNKEEL